MESGKITQDLGLSELNVENDRFMICGSPSMLKDTCAILNNMGFKEARGGNMGHYVVERAFVEQ
jgi:ferredoxin--NADP+ reductase